MVSNTCTEPCSSPPTVEDLLYNSDALDPAPRPETKRSRRASLTQMLSLSFRRNQGGKEKKQRRVSFGHVEESPKTYTLSSRIKKKMWYNEDELDLIRDRLRQALDGKSLEEPIDCLRGLELYINRERLVKTDESNFILLEHLHSMSFSEVEDDAFDINSLAASLSGESVQVGKMQAAEDSAEAYKIYLENFKPEAVNRFFRR